ncbi:MAG: universal stress protein [Salinibacter sp.]
MGTRPKKILEIADDHGVGMLAVASHGRTGVKRALLGSVAEKVIRQAPCPVFVVKSLGVSLVGEENDGD